MYCFYYVNSTKTRDKIHFAQFLFHLLIYIIHQFFYAIDHRKCDHETLRIHFVLRINDLQSFQMTQSTKKNAVHQGDFDIHI